jgi:hypothetical protein
MYVEHGSGAGHLEISREMYDEYDDCGNDAGLHQQWWDKLKSVTGFDRLQRGDLIRTPIEYRNNGVLGLFDKEGSIIPLEYDSGDDYGTVPREFTVLHGGFSPDHWFEEVDHNCYVWLDLLPYLDEIKNTIENENDNFTFTFEHEVYKVCLCSDSPLTIDDITTTAQKGPIQVSVGETDDLNTFLWYN